MSPRCRCPGRPVAQRLTSGVCGDGWRRVYDPVGMIVPSLKCIAWNGRLVVVGFAAGTIEKVRLAPTLASARRLGPPREC